MQKLVLGALIISLLFVNCTKEKEVVEVDLKYELLDDVSPVTAIISHDLDVGWFEWSVDSLESYAHTDQKQRFEHIFSEPGEHLVEFNASGEGVEGYYGKVNIDIPEIANRLVLSGFSFKEEYDFDIEEDSLAFNFTYNDGSSITYFSTRVSNSDFENFDSLGFENPIVIDIPDIPKAAEDNAVVHFGIENVNTAKSYFRCNFYIRDWYYHDRLYAPNYIYLNNIVGENRERIYLTADWSN